MANGNGGRIEKKSAMSEDHRAHLVALRGRLLGMHKMLIDLERAAYEGDHGPVTPGHLLRLLLEHERFAWLRRLSELVVQIDESFQDEEATDAYAHALVRAAGDLLAPPDPDSDFGARYLDALQREPEIIIAHGQLVRFLGRIPGRDA